METYFGKIKNELKWENYKQLFLKKKALDLWKYIEKPLSLSATLLVNSVKVTDNLMLTLIFCLGCQCSGFSSLKVELSVLNKILNMLCTVYKLT